MRLILILMFVFISGCSTIQDQPKTSLINIEEAVIVMDKKVASKILEHIKLYPRKNMRYKPAVKQNKQIYF